MPGKMSKVIDCLVNRAVKRLESSRPGYQALAERSTLTPKRTCWEAINGQIQCDPDYSDVDSSSDTSTMTLDMDTSTDDDSTDDTDSTPTTCVHTADGFIQCGDVMVKREDPAYKRDIISEPVAVPFPIDLMKRSDKIDGYTGVGPVTKREAGEGEEKLVAREGRLA
ncbi:MAG: hypothetical protein Q9208_006244 [Pyrenodesmia sp. 3 TL-2023]